VEGDRIRPDDFSFDIAAENTGSLTSPQAIVFIKHHHRQKSLQRSFAYGGLTFPHLRIT